MRERAAKRKAKQEQARRRRMEATETFKETDAQKMYSWRVAVLKEAGMPGHLAMLVADSSFDLHKAVDMLKAGCDPEVLVSIAT